MLNTLDLNTLDSALQRRAGELAGALAKRNLITIERTADALDQSLLAAERESLAHNLEQGFQLLRQVEAARNRLRQGTFAICLGCEERISPKRLQAIPWAAYCVTCQTRAEEGEMDPPKLLRAA